MMLCQERGGALLFWRWSSARVAQKAGRAAAPNAKAHLILPPPEMCYILKMKISGSTTIRNGKRVLVSRAVMEEALGRKLEEWEEVHHKDGNRRNNSLENLMVVKPDEHRAIHRGIRAELAGPPRAICDGCGAVFFVGEMKNGWRSRARYCSHKCRQEGRVKQRFHGGPVEDSHSRQNRLDRKINIKSLATHLEIP